MKVVVSSHYIRELHAPVCPRHVAQGQIFGFPGPNGARKSTTINMLCTLMKPSAGSATINGHDIVHERHLVRRSIGLAFRRRPDARRAPHGAQNMRFHAILFGVPAEQVRAPRTRARRV